MNSCLAALIDDPIHPIFVPYNIIWKDKVPNKVRFMVWSIAWGRVNTNHPRQKKRLGMTLSPYWCIMCRRNLESFDYYFLHCSVACNLWCKLFQEANISRTSPFTCRMLLVRNGKVLWEPGWLSFWCCGMKGTK